MTLDPRWGFFIGLLTAILAFNATAQGSQYLIDIIGTNWGHWFGSLSGYLAAIGGIVTGVLHAIPSKDTPEALKTFYLRPREK